MVGLTALFRAIAIEKRRQNETRIFRKTGKTFAATCSRGRFELPIVIVNKREKSTKTWQKCIAPVLADRRQLKKQLKGVSRRKKFEWLYTEIQFYAMRSDDWHSLRTGAESFDTRAANH
jgi:hypothetical protein